MPVHTLSIDPAHSAAEFAVTYAMNSIIKGRFLDLTGSITLDTDNPASSSATARIDAASVWTHAGDRDEHLKSADFFDVGLHDQIAFDSTAVEVVEGNHWHVHGALTMLDQTRPVTLDAHFYGITRDPNGETRAGFVAETDIRRSDWGLLWNDEQETGVLVSDRVRVSLYISAKPADSAAPDDTEITEGDEDTNGQWRKDEPPPTEPDVPRA